MSYTVYNIPFFKHDCEQCKYLKSVKNDKGLRIDIYQSCNNLPPSLLIRYSSEMADYNQPPIESLAMYFAEKMRF